MKIIIADYSGFCFGVERAVNIVEDTAKFHDNVYTLGPIIHNPQLVERLKGKGINVKDDVEFINSEETVIIRSHGIPKESFLALKAKNTNVIDATCPFVTRAQEQAEALTKDGYFLVIFGERDHPEVKGIVSYCTGEYAIVENEEETEKDIDFKEKIGVIAQTTQNKANFSKIVEVLREKCKELKVINTICNATTLRQEAGKKVALISDIMYVIGGKNSGNTTRLYEICKQICPKVYHIETKDDINVDDLKGTENIGITAGASTPKYLIDEVIEFLKEVENAGK
jgi:4-hydroxy-3-methylbut-2-enyl diphosphate reductase